VEDDSSLVACMKADSEVVCSIDKSYTRQKKERQKEEEANCVVYHLSCRKCQIDEPRRRSGRRTTNNHNQQLT